MDFCDNKNALSIEELEDEPYYFSPACGPEDVVWPGSDWEETTEETEQRRSRYEHHARRYMRGHLPVLQSAALRGPLSGWVNPWRWVPKQDEWWQPGSEDMLFTREKVMKRAADHGLGYLGPTEALAWCKASAQAEAQPINRHFPMEQEAPPEIGSTLVELDLEEPQDHLMKGEVLNPNLKPTNPYEHQSMINHQSKSPYLSDHVGEETKRTKRPVDAHWLKGSRVSKRARRDSPEIATPTPHHKVTDKNQRRHQSFRERSGSNNRITHTTSRLSTSFTDTVAGQGQMDVTLDNAMLDASQDQGQMSTASAFTPNSTYKRSSIEQIASISHLEKVEDDEIQEISRESFFTSSLRSKSSRKPLQRSPRSTEVSPDIVKAVESDIITPRKHSQNSILPAEDVPRDVTQRSISNELPKLRHQRLQSGRHLREFDEEDEYSFITEVAPSSRDLEMFQYKKKRKRKDIEVLKANQNNESSEARLQTTPERPLLLEHGVQHENIRDNGDSIEAKIYDGNSTSLSFVDVLVAEDERQGKSNQSDQSWELVDDGLEQPLALSLGSVSPGKSTSSKRHSRINRNSHRPSSQILKPGSKSSSQRSKMSRGSTHQSQSLPEPQEGSPKSPATKRKAGIFQDLNNASTQSYNTSPPRPTPYIPFEPLPQTTIDDHPQVATRSVEVQDVIRGIQKSAAQQSPKSKSPVTTRSDKSQDLEYNDLDKIKPISVQNPPLDRIHAFRPSSADMPCQSSAGGNMRTTESEIDEVVEIADVSDLKTAGDSAPLQGTPRQRLFSAEASRKEAESKDTPSPAVSIARTQHISFKETNEPLSQQRDQGEVSGAVTSDKITTTSSLEESHPPRDTDPQPSSIDLNTSWEGCGPQSPWAAENLELLPVKLPSQVGTTIMNGTPLASSLVQRLSSPDSDDRSVELDWQAIERPQTPAGFITPFKDLMSPSPEPEARNHLESKVLPNTQSLVDAATNNPWTSNLKNPSSKKSNKRVSFGVLELEEKENSQPDLYDEVHRLRRSPGSPPPPQQDSEEDIYYDGTATLPKFIGHFVAARQFKHILPLNTSSPANSSPHLSAQAEAFLAADRRASADRRLSRFSPKSPSHKSRADTDRIQNSWTRDTSLDLVQTSSKSPEKRMGNLIASFDMEEAIGDMSDFLGDDWSVDTELKKAKRPKESESSARRESNGHKRRRLFGLV